MLLRNEPEQKQHTVLPRLPLILLGSQNADENICLTTLHKNDSVPKTHLCFRCIRFTYLHSIFRLACCGFLFLCSRRAREQLTSADLWPSRFTRLISTPRMTAPANCTSVCPLTQRPARLLSKVRSGSDYNLFPSSLCVSFTTSWQQLFRLISLEIATSRWRRRHLRSEPRLNQRGFIWLSSVAV